MNLARSTALADVDSRQREIHAIVAHQQELEDR